MNPSQPPCSAQWQPASQQQSPPSPNPPKPPAPRLPASPKKKCRWPFLLAAGLLLAAGAALAFFVLWRGGVTLAPSAQTAEGIAPDASFTLRLPSPAEDLSALTASIILQPSTPFALTPDENAPGSYTLTPARAFAPGSSLSVQVGVAHPFTFQVQNRLVLTGVFPARGSSQVPLLSGVEFGFNATDIDMLSFRVGFSISPPVAGGFQAVDGRTIFYPAGAMQPGTEYTVSLSADVASASGAKLGEAVSASFTTQSEAEAMIDPAQRQFQFYGSGFGVTALTSEAPVYSAYLAPQLVQATGSLSEMSVEVFAFPSAEAYAQQLSQNLARAEGAQVSVDTAALTSVGAFGLTPLLISDEGYNSDVYILEFPQPLPKGWYAVNFTYGQGGGVPISRQQFLQVSDTSVFTMWSGQNLLAWVNDAATGQPIQGAAVSLSGGFSGTATTGADGVATLSEGNPPATKEYTRFGDLIQVQNGSDLFVDIENYYYYGWGSGSIATRGYISTLFCDRPIYRTEDTIQAFGVLRPRSEAVQPPEAVRLSLSLSGLELAGADVQFAEDGSYTAQLPFSNLEAGYYSVRLEVGGEVVLEDSLRVEDFEKPVYTASVESDKPIYLLGQDNTAALTLDVSLFDGTPASGMAMDFYADGAALAVDDLQAATDDAGSLRVALSLLESGVNTWRPQNNYYSFSNADAQSENLYRSGNVTVVNRDLMLQGAPVAGGSGTLAVSTHRVATAGLTPARTSYGTAYFNDEQLMGPPVDTEVRYEVYRSYHVQEISGTYYDFVSRTTQNRYIYQRQEELVSSGTVTTQGGAATIEGLPTPDKDNGYFVVLTGADSLNRPVENTTWLAREYSRSYGYYEGYRRYSLRNQAPAPTGENYWYGGRFTDGENLTFRLAENEVELAEMPGRLLTTAVKDAFTHVAVHEGPQVSLPFEEALLPNYSLTGAYFDGKHIFPLEDTYMAFNPEARALDVTLTPSAASTAPGAQVQVTAGVTQRRSGAPAAGARVALAVVDEAVFALQEQYVDVLEQYYRQMSYPPIQKYVSYTQPYRPTASEKGGGGGEEGVRSDFENTAVFLTAATDSTGKATFSFQLPDNITTWRLTGVAIGENATAGNGRGALTSTKPFFVAPVVNTALLSGDSCAIGLYGAGASVLPTEETHYTVTLEGQGIEQMLTATSPLRSYASVNFGALPLGEYTLTVQGQCGEYEDAVQLPIRVVESMAEVSAVASFDVAEGIDIQPLRQPVSVRFYGEGGRNSGALLRSLRRASSGSRADMRLARAFVAEMLGQGGEETEAGLQGLDGRSLMRLFPYASTSLELTTKAHLAAPALVGGAFLQDVFTPGSYSNYESSPAWLNLARVLAGQPLGVDLAAEAQEEGRGNILSQRLIFATALALSGDTASAQRVFDEQVLPRLVESTSVSGQVLLSLPADGANSEAEYTAAASWLATTLKLPQAEGLVLCLAERSSEYEPYLLEQMYYLSTFGTGAGATASFTSEELAQAGFTVPEGATTADVYYTAAPSALQEEGRRIGLTKTVEPVEGTAITPGALVCVTLTPDFSGLDIGVGERMLLIDDVVPSGLRFVQYEMGGSYNGFATGWSLARRQGQRLQFYVTGLLGTSGVTPIQYYARVATPGEYIVESAVISSASGESWGASERDILHVEN